MELDIFIPSLNLAFEYQGEQHFHETNHATSLEQIQMHDKEKRNACEQAKITLIEVTLLGYDFLYCRFLFGGIVRRNPY